MSEWVYVLFKSNLYFLKFILFQEFLKHRHEIIERLVIVQIKFICISYHYLMERGKKVKVPQIYPQTMYQVKQPPTQIHNFKDESCDNIPETVDIKCASFTKSQCIDIEFCDPLCEWVSCASVSNDSIESIPTEILGVCIHKGLSSEEIEE